MNLGVSRSLTIVGTRAKRLVTDSARARTYPVTTRITFRTTLAP